jgi:AcrR family transcriptional regulator
VSESVAAVPLREQQRAYTRSKLLESARQVFVTRGFPDATVDDIAREAGASRATFYLHFRSKTDVAAALVDEGTPFAVAQYRTLDKLLCEGGPRLREELHEWLSKWLDIWTESAGAWHALQAASVLEPELEALRLRQSATLIDTLERYFAQMPEDERKHARERALLLEIMTQRIFSLASTRELPVANDGILSTLLDMWYHTLIEQAPAHTTPENRS